MLAAPLVAAGLVLLFFATGTEAHLVDQDVWTGQAPPGGTLVPINRTDYGAAILSTEELPCPLLIYPLTALDYLRFEETGALPPDPLNCQLLNRSTGDPIPYLLLRNVDPTDSLNYTVEIQFYQVTQPRVWLTVPGAGLLLSGTVVVILWFLRRGVGSLVESFERKD